MLSLAKAQQCQEQQASIDSTSIMSDKQIRRYFQVIGRQIEALKREGKESWVELSAALEDLQIIYEQMQTNLEVFEVTREGLLQQNQQLIEGYRHYCDLFQLCPIAYLFTNAYGLILEANQAIAQLLNVPQRYLIGKPLILYVVEEERLDFSLRLNRLSQERGTQVWQMTLCPHNEMPLTVQLQVGSVCGDSGVEELRIGVQALGSIEQRFALEAQQLGRGVRKFDHQTVKGASTHSLLSQSLNGLRVLVVDDEADARELITAVLESYGIGIRAVASAAAALEELERFHPDVLLSDIRMPGGDGYSLIRQIRALEAEQGWHIPAAAVTAYLEEDREKTLIAGFEAHLHKLAQPDE